MASILNNVGSIFAQRNLGQAQKGLNITINRLSTGMRINKAADDAAGLQISNNLRADIAVLNQGRRNANDGLGRIAIADGVLEEATNLLTRAATLAEQAASGTTTSAGRVALNNEFTEIKAAINDLGSNTKYDGSNVFNATFDIVAGDNSVSVTTSALTAAGLSLAAAFDNAGNSATALTEIEAAISTISSDRGTLGAKAQRLNTIVNSMGITAENVVAAESQIRDADIASEVVNLTKFQILSQTGVSALAQANQSSQSVLSLLG